MERGIKHVKKNRSIPFGYCMRNGEIIPEHTETKAVQYIFNEYIQGCSLNEIATFMMTKNIPYSEGSRIWNKNMIKRILEN